MSDNMKISVMDYGPIAEAKNIDLCPLTVFVGPSNTGKSYLAILVYALLKSFALKGINRGNGFFYGEARSKIPAALIERLHEDGGSLTFADLPASAQKEISKKLSETISEDFLEEFFRCMGVSQKDSGALAGSKFSFVLEDATKKISIKPQARDSHVEVLGAGSTLTRHDVGKMFWRVAAVREGSGKDSQEAMAVMDALACRLYPNDYGLTSYLPAPRMGGILSYRAIAGGLVQQAARANAEPTSVPTLNGVMSDFLQQLIVMDYGSVRDKDVCSIAQAIEKKILHGTIEVKFSNVQFPQFFYKFNGQEIPLLRSSSMVSELAPVVLFLKHKVSKGDLLIIEEPEAHLHPAAQVQMAEVIVRLIRAGVRVMVTTHSTDFLDALSNYVRKGQLKNRKNGELVLDESELGAYVFRPRKKGTVVERLAFDKEAGISSIDHEETVSALYNATASALQRLDDEEAGVR